jgi:hypothetical protein
MLSTEQLKTILNFVIDSAKIIFGSLVIGVFVPSISGEISWSTFIIGVIMTLTFLGISLFLSSKIKKINSI